MKKSLLLAVFALFFAVFDAAAQGDYRLDKNIMYRPDLQADEYANKMCRLDVYAPANAKDAPVIVWFHGGGFTGGERDLPGQLQNKGFIIATVDYRLSPSVKVADCFDDGAAAVAWVIKNLEKYGGSPKKVYLAGHSAGATLILMLGLDKHYLAKYGVDADGMAALLPYSSQMVTHYTARKERGIPDTQPIIDELAPLYHVRPDAPPIILTTGQRENELLGRYEENAYFWRMMKIVGHPDITLYEFGGFDHGNMPLPAHDITVRYIRERERAARGN